MKDRRPGFLSPLHNPPALPLALLNQQSTHTLKRPDTPILSPIRYTIKDRIGSLCLQLKRSSLYRERKPPKPKRFTFTLEDILKSRSQLSSNLSNFVGDWRTFPSPAIRIYSARRLSRRISSRV